MALNLAYGQPPGGGGPTPYVPKNTQVTQSLNFVSPRAKKLMQQQQHQGDEQFQQPQQPVQPPKSNKYSLDVDALINDVELEDDRIQQRAEAVHLAPVRPAGRPQGSPTGRGGGGGGGGANNRISPTNFDAPLGIPPEQRHGSAGLGPSHWQQLKRERDYFMERATGFEERCKQLIRENRELSSRRVHEEESFRQVLMMEKVRYDRLHGKLDVKCQDRDMLLLDWVKLMDAYNVTRNFPFVSEMVARTAMVVPAARPYVPMEYSESISESAGGKRPKTKGRRKKKKKSTKKGTKSSQQNSYITGGGSDEIKEDGEEDDEEGGGEGDGEGEDEDGDAGVGGSVLGDGLDGDSPLRVMKVVDDEELANIKVGEEGLGDDEEEVEHASIGKNGVVVGSKSSVAKSKRGGGVGSGNVSGENSQTERENRERQAKAQRQMKQRQKEAEEQEMRSIMEDIDEELDKLHNFRENEVANMMNKLAVEEIRRQREVQEEDARKRKELEMKKEKERLEREKKEKEEAEKLEKERLEREKKEREKFEKEKAERDKLEKERLEREKKAQQQAHLPPKGGSGKSQQQPQQSSSQSSNPNGSRSTANANGNTNSGISNGGNGSRPPSYDSDPNAPKAPTPTASSAAAAAAALTGSSPANTSRRSLIAAQEYRENAISNASSRVGSADSATSYVSVYEYEDVPGSAGSGTPDLGGSDSRKTLMVKKPVKKLVKRKKKGESSSSGGSSGGGKSSSANKDANATQASSSSAGASGSSSNTAATTAPPSSSSLSNPIGGIAFANEPIPEETALNAGRASGAASAAAPPIGSKGASMSNMNTNSNNTGAMSPTFNSMQDLESVQLPPQSSALDGTDNDKDISSLMNPRQYSNASMRSRMLQQQQQTPPSQSAPLSAISSVPVSGATTASNINTAASTPTNPYRTLEQMKQRVDTINQNLQNLQSTTSDSVVGKMPAISTGAGRGLGGIEGSSDFDVSFDKSSMALGSLLYDSQDGGKGGKGGGSDYDDVLNGLMKDLNSLSHTTDSTSAGLPSAVGGPRQGKGLKLGGALDDD